MRKEGENAGTRSLSRLFRTYVEAVRTSMTQRAGPANVGTNVARRRFGLRLRVQLSFALRKRGSRSFSCWPTIDPELRTLGARAHHEV